MKKFPTAQLYRRALPVLLAALLVLPMPTRAADAQVYAGLEVEAVLRELRSQGLTFVYNSEIVPPDLRISGEPRARTGLALAREILAAHDLGLMRAGPGVYAVVRQSPGSPIAEPPVPSSPPSTATPLEEVIVQTSRYTLEAEAGAATTLMTQKEVENVPQMADEPLRAVQRLPGIVTNGFSSIGAVRGGEPNETAVILDGLRLYEPFHLKNFLSPVSLLDSRSIAAMNVHSGGFPVLYGDRMSSIIDATSVRVTQDRYYELFLSLFHAGGLASTSFADGRGHGLISGRRSNAGDLARYSERDFGKPHYADGLVRIDYEIDEQTRGALNVLASNDHVNALRAGGSERADARYRNTYLWGTLDRDWSQQLSSRLILSYTDVANDRDGTVDSPGQRVGRVKDERSFHIVGMRLENEWDQSAVTHRFGAEVRQLWGRYDYAADIRFESGYPVPGAPARRVSYAAGPRPHGFETAAYWDSRYHLGSQWSLQGGMRFDTQTYDGSNDAAQWSPRLGVLYAPDEMTHLRASWGRFFQSQGINELQVEDGIDRFYQAQHADHAILSIERTFAAGFDLRVEAYRKDYRGIRPRFENLLNPLVLLPEVEFDRVMIAPESARAEGAEILVRMHPRGGWSAWASYVWSRAWDRIAGDRVLRSWDQTHAINLGISWSREPWTVTVADSYHTGWPTTALHLAIAPDGSQRIEFGSRNAQRLPYYNSLDVRVTRTFPLPRGVLEVFVEATNAFSRGNPCCLDYSASTRPDGSIELQSEYDSWLPLVPSFGLLWRY